jgi:hypothetical protein
MKVILTSEDIEKLIRDTYESVEEVKVDNKIEIEIKVSSDALKTKNKINIKPMPKPTAPEPEAPPQSGRPSGVMGNREEERVMARF